MADAGAGRRADRIARLRLIRTPRIGPVTYRQLIERFGSAEAALAGLPDLAARGGGAAPAIPTIASAEREAAAVEAAGARYLFLGERGYPPLLNECPDAPPVLTARGDAALLTRPAVAMVGARNASAAACRLARQLGHELATRGVTVVSGVARGIDTAAHQGSLDGGTVGVVAGGIAVAYPPENAALQEEIATRGLLLAEMPPGVEPRARHFPNRNRIIAGVAQAVLVIEAAPKSGSLITARQGGEYGREVLAVPGSPLDPRAQGCNLLIREGATLVQTADDVMEALRPMPHVSAPIRDYEAGRPAEAGPTERARLMELLGPTPAPIDELIRLSGLPPSVVMVVLLELELAGRLDRHAGARVSLI